MASRLPPFLLLALVATGPTAPARAQGGGVRDAGAAAARDGGAAGAAKGTETDEPRAPKQPLRVAVTGSEPFVIRDGHGFDGVSVDIWRAVATDLGVEYELLASDTAAQAIHEVEKGGADVAVGPLSITADRAREVDFTQPYFQSALGILAPPEGRGLWARLRPFLSAAFLGGALVLLLVLVGVGVLLWLFERKANPDHFPTKPAQGIANGMWMALVTMTTVGYGDRVPVTTGGRVVAGIWMVVAMLTASSITAFLATAFTVAQLDKGAITKAGQLDGHRVAVVRGTTAVNFVESHGGRPVYVDDIDGAVKKVQAHGADAIVFDRPALQYELRQKPELDLVLSDASYMPQGYGFAATLGTGLSHRMSVSLLGLAESGRLEAIERQYLGRGP